MKLIIIAPAIALFTLLVGFPRSSVAQTSGGPCTVEITIPAMNAHVGDTADVSGTAKIPPGTRLWVFAHRKGLAMWWPQGDGAAKIEAEKWIVVAHFGLPRDIGSDFEVTTRIVEDKSNAQLQQWVKNSVETLQYPAISLPEYVHNCLSNTVTVTKDH